MNNCKECNYKDNYFNTGHCYMFKNEPRECGQFRAKPYAKTYQPTTTRRAIVRAAAEIGKETK